MAEFERLHAGNSEIQEKQAIAFDFAQTATPGLVATGVLAGLTVVQTSTASGSVVIGTGAGVVGSTVGAGASEAINPGDVTFNVLTANPVGGLPRNDIIVWDSVTKMFSVAVGTPNATPSDPTVANTKLPLARLRHAASATTIPIAKIDDLRILTGLRGAPILVSSQAQRDALVAYDGLSVYRLDRHIVETYDGSAWPAWITPALSNSWAVYGAGFEGPQYRKAADGTIQLRGTILSGTTGTTVFTLPAGFRPHWSVRFACASNAGIAFVSIDYTTGVVKVDGYLSPGSNTQVSLDGIFFSGLT